MVKLKPICNFVEWELEKFRKECNFTKDERECFELNVSESTVNRLVKKIKKKIIKVL